MYAYSVCVDISVGVVDGCKIEVIVLQEVSHFGIGSVSGPELKQDSM